LQKTTMQAGSFCTSFFPPTGMYITIDGIEAVDAFMLALDEGKPYDLVCLDIMMPKLDGTRALKAIRMWKSKGN